MEHHFDVEFAAEHGFAAAVIYRHFQFWIAHNKANGQNERNGRTWSYNSVRAFQELFPYLTQWDIREAVKHLLKRGLLIKDHFGGGYDRTSWYAFGDEKAALKALPEHLRITQMDNTKSTNGLSESRKCIIGSDKEPIVEPDNKENCSQKGLSGKAEKEHAFALLIHQGVGKRVAESLVYDFNTPLYCIEETIKNGIAKQAKEPRFKLGPGYIIETLNAARREGKLVNPTKASREFSLALKSRKILKPVIPITQNDIKKFKKEDWPKQESQILQALQSVEQTKVQKNNFDKMLATV
jgi:hypothetical protein